VVDVAYMGAYGLAIVIDNGHAIGTVYAHLSRTRVAKGDIVHQGDQIGNVGCSGWCTGPHVHFEVRVASKPQNPIFWL
jgi:murein DD-endopeptidase MepM/ murein hydrolase activator NlpD